MRIKNENENENENNYAKILWVVIKFNIFNLYGSSNINGVIKDNFRSFFTKRFYIHKKVHTMQTSDFHPDIFIRPEIIKKQTSNFYS